MILTLLFIIIALVVIVLATINLWLPYVIKTFVEKKSNFPTKVQASKCSLTRGVVDLEGINLKNPTGKFEEENLITVNKLSASVEYNTIFQKQIIIPEVTVDVENFTCDKNKDGDINAMVLANSFSSGDKEETDEEKKKKEEEEEEKKKKEEEEQKENENKEGKSILIRKLTIRLGSVVLNNIPTDGEHKFEINKTLNFENVNPENKKDIIEQILNDPDIQKAGISEAMHNAINEGKKMVNQEIKKYTDQGKKMLNEAKDKINDYIPQNADDAKAKLDKVLPDDAKKQLQKVQDAIPDDVAKKAEEQIKKVIPDDAAQKAQEALKNAIPDDAAKKAEEKIKNALPGGLKSLFG